MTPRPRWPGWAGTPCHLAGGRDDPGPLRRLLRRSKPLVRKLYRRIRIPPIRRTSDAIICNVNAVDEAAYPKRALLLYIPAAFLLPEDDPGFLRHQNRERCKRIAALLGEFGYVVDAADGKAPRLRPRHRYDLLLSDRAGLQGWRPLLKEGAVKLFLATSINYRDHNRKVRRRHELLRARRGCEIQVRRIYGEEMSYAAESDAIICVGNDFTASTWNGEFDVPIYSFNNHGFEGTKFGPDQKDWASARSSFLFFASRSQIQKGLDLLLEIFPRHPDLHLYVCSAFDQESDFRACFHRELHETPNVHPIGWVTVNSDRFYELVRTCAYVIHPTCSEGQPGSVVQCMYAGLIPLVTREAGIDTRDFGITFADDSPDEIERVITEVSRRPESWHRERSLKTRAVSEAQYSQGALARRWREILTEIVDGAGLGS